MAPERSTPETKRTFVGVPLEGELREAALRAASTMRRSLADDRAVKWEKRESLHATLHFLGDTDVASLGAIEPALAEVAAGHAPFEISLAEPEWFPGRGRPRVFVVGVAAGASELAALQRDVAAALGRLGFPADRRPYRPHVTVARVRRNRKVPAGAADRACAAAADLAQGIRATVSGLVFFESVLSPEGATYTRLATLPLGRAS